MPGKVCFGCDIYELEEVTGVFSPHFKLMFYCIHWLYFLQQNLVMFGEIFFLEFVSPLSTPRLALKDVYVVGVL